MAVVRFPAAAEFGQQVRARRLELDLTLEGLAVRARLHPTYVGSVERGERNVGLWNVLRLAEALEVDPGTLVSGLLP